MFGWLVVLGFNSTLTAEVISWPENLKQAVKYEGYLRRKSVY